MKCNTIWNGCTSDCWLGFRRTALRWHGNSPEFAEHPSSPAALHTWVQEPHPSTRGRGIINTNCSPGLSQVCQTSPLQKGELVPASLKWAVELCLQCGNWAGKEALFMSQLMTWLIRKVRCGHKENTYVGDDDDDDNNNAAIYWIFTMCLAQR